MVPDDGISVLLIEDNPGDARLVAAMLAAVDGPLVRLRQADRLTRGLQQLGQGGIDAVLLDLSLPDADGLNGLAEIRARASLVPVVVLTGRDDAELAMQAVQHGAQDYLVKGQFRGAALVRALGYAIERARLQQTLQASEARYRALVEASPDAIVLRDLEGRTLIANSQAAALAGVASPAELAGFDFVAPEDRARARADLEGIRPQGIVRAREYLLQRVDGTRFPGELSAALLTEPGGRPSTMVTVLRDVTPRKQAEAERERILAAEQAARAEAETAIQLRDHVLATVSHDLKGALAVIKGYADLLQRGAQRGRLSPAQFVEIPAKISQGVERMAGQIDELLDVAQLQAGQPLLLHRSSTDLVALATQVVGDLQATSARHRIRVERSADALIGDWDPRRLWRVVDNLVANAVKYSPDGGSIQVVISREERAQGAYARLTVEDQGLGIPAAEVPHVLEAFYRASNVVGRVTGTGLGLAGARHIVEQHGGTITVDSQEGMGSSVTVHLPLGATGFLTLRVPIRPVDDLPSAPRPREEMGEMPRRGS